LGYLGEPARTETTFPLINGRRCAIAGDRARLLSSGAVELLGRDSVTINTGGEKVFVEEVEAAIKSHNAVHDVLVTGRPHPRWGQEIVALVQLRGSTYLTSVELVGDFSGADIVDHASRTLARYKLPHEVIFVEAIRRSAVGKPDYRWAAECAQASDGNDR
jgi:fatty-acyl-CoA synthase